MSCHICGNIQSQCTCQQSAQPYCEQCSEDNTCAQIMDSACVIYHPDETDPASKLLNTNLPNGTSIEKVVEELDKRMNSQNIPITSVDTSTIDMGSTGAGGHTISASVKVSTEAGNTLQVKTDGLFVPAAEGQTVDPITAAQIISLIRNDADFRALVCEIMNECMGACPGIVDITN